jgi:pimeloyl-ACP methyl ester carboxylesterase
MKRVCRLRITEGATVVEVMGSGPAVLCLHGVSANRATWDVIGRRLATRFTVLAPDLLGRGDSDRPAIASYRLEDEVRRAADLVHRAGIDRTLLVGHSHGAAIALGVARQLSSVAGLVLVNPVTPWSKRPLILSVPGLRRSRLAATALSRFRKPVTRYILERRVLGPAVEVGPDLVERYSAPYASEDRARALLAIVTDWHPDELLSWLPVARVPTLVLAGVHDRRMTVADTARLADLLGASYVVAARAGHALPDERPGLVCEAIREVAEPLELPSFDLTKSGIEEWDRAE